MALVLADRVKETTTTTGTGTVTLAGAVTGFQSFAAVGNANTTYYTIAGQGTAEWEVGIGTYTSVGTTLSRTTVLASSNAGGLVVFSAGTKDVFVTYPAGRSIYADGTTLTATNSSILPATSGGTGQSSYAVGDLVYASTTTALSKLADVATGNALISGGVGVAPSYGKIGLTTHISGTLATGNGGTGNTTGAAVTFTSTTQNSQFNSIGVGTAGSTTAGEIRATNNITAFYVSDIKFKENIRDIPNALATVRGIGGQLYDWTAEYIGSHGGEDGYFIRKADFGYIAQKVQEYFPLGVREKEDGSLAVDYQKMCALAFAAIKELDDKIEALTGDKT